MDDETLRKPRERSCELCGREEHWSDEEDIWTVVRRDGEPVVGNLHCIHEWDINGSFIPIEEPVNPADAW